jgi:hypothetical protein
MGLVNINMLKNDDACGSADRSKRAFTGAATVLWKRRRMTSVMWRMVDMQRGGGEER